MSVMKLDEKVLEVVSGGWVKHTVTQMNKSIIILSNFDASAKNGSAAGVMITVTQINSN